MTLRCHTFYQNQCNRSTLPSTADINKYGTPPMWRQCCHGPFKYFIILPLLVLKFVFFLLHDIAVHFCMRKFLELVVTWLDQCYLRSWSRIHAFWTGSLKSLLTYLVLNKKYQARKKLTAIHWKTEITVAVTFSFIRFFPDNSPSSVLTFIYFKNYLWNLLLSILSNHMHTNSVVAEVSRETFRSWHGEL